VPEPPALDKVTVDQFRERLQDRFRVAPEDGTVFDVVLIEATEIPREAGGRPPFSLIFQGGPNPPLPQGIYRVENDDLGAIEIFLVPIAADRYEAVFT
jgi:hypothetical protein